jgi:3D (Asp-Asp-Asp) domain-containing protein
VDTSSDLRRVIGRRLLVQRAVLGVALMGAVALTGASAAYVKRAGVPAPLVAVDAVRTGVSSAVETRAAASIPLKTETEMTGLVEAPIVDPVAKSASVAVVAHQARAGAARNDPSVRWFNGRPVRPARTMWMTVTAYSPDEKSCGPSACGITASLHSVYTNGMKMAAADTRVLPFGSMITVPGYDSGQIVPVLDRGGAIKGHRLDMLFPTDAEARAWGVKKMKVTVWEFADGKPAVDPRTLR